jgi:hypothetical protein
MSQVNLAALIELARQGNAKAIAQLLDSALQPRGITTKVTREQGRFTIFVDASEVPQQASVVGLIRKGIKDLEIGALESIKIYGRKIGDPSSGWREEVIFRPDLLPVTSAGNPSSGAKASRVSAEKLITQARLGFADLVTTISKIRISRRTAIAAGSFLLLALLTTGGVIGFNVWKTRSAQAQTIKQAHELVVASDISKASGIDALKASKEKLKQARDLLRGIPDGRGSLYSKAQAELTQVRSQLETIEQKIAAEESTTQTWAEADKLAQDAIASVQDPPHPLKTWKAAQTQLGQAIQQLEAIPEGTFVSRQVKTKLAAYRKQDTTISQGMMAEEKAVQTLQAADGLAKQAYDVTSGEYDFELSDLQAAQVAWQKAIAQLKKVPAKSHAYKDVASRMTLYSNNSREIADGIKELKTCSAKNSFSCGYVSLDLRTPTKSSTSSDEFDDSSNFSDSYSSDELTNENY